MTTPPTKPCKSCKRIDPVFKTVQLNLTQWRCGSCNYFLEAIDYPSNLYPAKMKHKEVQKDA